jgi:glucose-6-phosphate 1-dehydrogenase
MINMKNNDKFIFIIFGASGDLTRRKLIPAIYNLFRSNLLQENQFLVLGASRTRMSDDAFRMKVMDDEFVNKNDTDHLRKFEKNLFYLPLDTGTTQAYGSLKSKLEELSKIYDFPRNYLFYLSTPPSMFEIIASGLSKHQLNIEEDSTFKRLIIEKPFGYDLESSERLNQKLHACFDESQIFRIDHYLGKETVQNLLVTRFSNSIFEPLWNRNFIHHIEITSAESEGVGNRGGYYDTSGALRDMVQNHLLNLMAMVAMEPPVNLSSLAIRNETVKVFHSVRKFTKKDIASHIIRGQYTTAHIHGKAANGYREEQGVDKQSQTETYVALKIWIDNWRWSGVPFYVRTGKCLPTRVTEIVVHFKSTPQYLFKSNHKNVDENNILVFRIQPDEGILLKFGIKTPGTGFDKKSVNMDFHYSDYSDIYIPEAYERLLLDAVNGDATLYPRSDSVDEAWKLVDPILEEWKTNKKLKLYGYPAGTWGPEHADDLIEGKEIQWRYPCKNLSNDGIYCEL